MKKKKVICLCCGYRTLEERGAFDICPVCFWEDDPYIMFEKMDETGEIDSVYNHNNCDDEDYTGEDVLDIASSANDGLTLRQGRTNYKKFGACCQEMLQYCRKPRKTEIVSYELELTPMPRKKKTEVASVAEVKADVVTELVTEAVAEIPAEKPAKKPAAKTAKAATAPKETVKIQFGADEYDFAEIKKAVEADCKSKVNGKIKSIEIYIKPEDKAVYYVVNGDFSDKIAL